MATIFKVQRPMNNPRHPWFFYAEGKRFLRMREPAEQELAAMGESQKMYAEYEGERGPEQFLRRVEDQNW